METSSSLLPSNSCFLCDLPAPWHAALMSILPTNSSMEHLTSLKNCSAWSSASLQTPFSKSTRLEQKFCTRQLGSSARLLGTLSSLTSAVEQVSSWAPRALHSRADPCYVKAWFFSMNVWSIFVSRVPRHNWSLSGSPSVQGYWCRGGGEGNRGCWVECSIQWWV